MTAVENTRPSPAQHTHHMDKGKGIVADQDGFQHVNYRKRNTRRNIFGKIYEEERDEMGHPGEAGIMERTTKYKENALEQLGVEVSVTVMVPPAS